MRMMWSKQKPEPKRDPGPNDESYKKAPRVHSDYLVTTKFEDCVMVEFSNLDRREGSKETERFPGVFVYMSHRQFLLATEIFNKQAAFIEATKDTVVTNHRRDVVPETDPLPRPWLKPVVTVGHCIYCGKKPPDCKRLSAEHVVPIALDGLKNDSGANVVLQKASCEDCEEKTKLLENRVVQATSGSKNAKIHGVAAHRGGARRVNFGGMR